MGPNGQRIGASPELRAALSALIGRTVVAAIAPAADANPIVSFAGVLEGAAEHGDDRPALSIVVGGQHLTLWPQQLHNLRVERDPRDGTFQLRLPEGAVITFYAAR